MSDHFLGSFRQNPPALGRLRINPGVGPDVLGELTARGHKLVVSDTPLSAAATVISIHPQSRLLRAAGDPRARRHAGAF
jgi:gamma-glutamyltranspeptidase